MTEPTRSGKIRVTFEFPPEELEEFLQAGKAPAETAGEIQRTVVDGGNKLFVPMLSRDEHKSTAKTFTGKVAYISVCSNTACNKSNAIGLLCISGCNEVKYCSDKCRKKHRSAHQMNCSKYKKPPSTTPTPTPTPTPLTTTSTVSDNEDFVVIETAKEE